MLYVIQKGYNNVPPRNASEIVYCITPVQKIVDLQLNFMFTDGHAVDSFSRHFTSDKRADLDTILDWEAIKNPVWKDEDDPDRKRRKSAEFLVFEDIPVQAILGYVVATPSAAEQLISLGVSEANVSIKPGYYF